MLGRGRNRREQSADPCAHAEILALREAGREIGDWRLDGTTVYVTVEPCPMCAAALAFARVERVVFGAEDKAYGACGSLMDMADYPGMPHHVEAVGGCMADACRALLQSFFEQRRSAKPLP